MSNVLTLAALLFAISIVIDIEAADGAATVSLSLLVEFDGSCKADFEEIADDVRDHVVEMCNCIVISSSIECCIGQRAVYNLSISGSVPANVTDSSFHAIPHIMKLQHCYYGNCTCDSNTASSDTQQIILIMAMICCVLFILVLITLLIVCYKCYRLHYQRKTVKGMMPAPIPIPRSPRQHQQSVIGSSEYIGPADIASPTFPPTFHHSNNHCHLMHMVNGSVDVIQQSTAIVQFNVHNTDTNVCSMDNNGCNTDNNVSNTVLNCNIASSPTVTQQQQAQGEDTLDHSVTGDSKPLHGTITTPTGLVAVINLPNGTTDTTDHIISSQKYPGYFEHKINDTHL